LSFVRNVGISNFIETLS